MSVWYLKFQLALLLARAIATVVAYSDLYNLVQGPEFWGFVRLMPPNDRVDSLKSGVTTVPY
jgi:hypothetical protein